MFVQVFYFVSYYFYWIEYDDFFFYFQETYDRYEDDPSTHQDFDPDLWIEVGSSGGPDKNRVYRLSNTTADNLRAARSVSTIENSQSYRAPNLRSSWLCSNTRLISSKNTSNYRWIMNKARFMSPKNTSNSRPIMSNSAKWSWTLHHRKMIHVRSLFGRMVPGTTSLLLLLLL
jgi:hypothetical protein